MALVWYEGFDETTTGSQVFTNIGGSGTSIRTTGGRTGSQCLQLAANFGVTCQQFFVGLGDGDCLGGALSIASYPTGTSQVNLLEQISSNDPTHPFVGLCLLSNGTMQFHIHNSTLVGSPTSFQLPLNQYHYYELDVVYAAPGSGEAFAYLDGSLVLSITGQTFADTVSPTPDTQANGFSLNSGGGNVTILYDDMYFTTHYGFPPYTGGLNVDPSGPLGDCAVVQLLTTASGDFTQWAIGGSAPKATNWQSVNEVPPDGDVTFVSAASGASGSAGIRDSYKFTTFPPATFTNVGSIIAAQVMGFCETDTAGLAQLVFSARQAGVDLLSPAFTLGVGYIYNRWITLVDVNGNSWTVPNLNATQFGMKRTA